MAAEYAIYGTFSRYDIADEWLILMCRRGLIIGFSSRAESLI